LIPNLDQADTNGNGIGDVCEVLLTSSVVDIGGGECLGLDYSIDYLSLGQVVYGTAAGTSYTIENGFVNGATGE